MFLFTYKVFDYIGLLKQVLRIQSFYGIKTTKWSNAINLQKSLKGILLSPCPSEQKFK